MNKAPYPTFIQSWLSLTDRASGRTGHYCSTVGNNRKRFLDGTQSRSKMWAQTRVQGFANAKRINLMQTLAKQYRCRLNREFSCLKNCFWFLHINVMHREVVIVPTLDFYGETIDKTAAPTCVIALSNGFRNLLRIYATMHYEAFLTVVREGKYDWILIFTPTGLLSPARKIAPQIFSYLRDCVQTQVVVERKSLQLLPH